MKHIVDKFMPCEDGGSRILVRVYYDPGKCEILLGKEYGIEDGKVVDISLSYDIMGQENPQFKLDMERLRQDMVCQAEGHCICTCTNR